ncbi:MAG: 2-dehydropantoate 2-reductase [Pseudomonadota bacterium]
MRIATFATGGIGGFLAVKLTHRGHDVATIARAAHLTAIKTAGLSLERDGARETVRPWKATDRAEDVGPVDVVLFAVKGDHLEAAARSALPLLGPDTLVVPFLNGVEASDRLARFLPPQNVGNGVAYLVAAISSPGTIRQTGTLSRFIFAERDSRATRRVEALRSAFLDAGLEAPATRDIVYEVWTKFVFFSALSGVTTATRCSIEDVRTNPATARLFREVMEETAALARARGVCLSRNVVDRHWDLLQSLPGETRSSTYTDLANGAPLETPWINGAVARLSAETGLTATANRTIHALLAPHIAGKAKLQRRLRRV